MTANTAMNGEGVAPLPYSMNWTNRTCPQFAPQSIAQTRLTRQRVKDWGLPIIHAEPARPGKFVLVGSSPYVVDFIPEIRRLADAGATVFAINSAHNLMLDEHIPLAATVLYEGGPDNHVMKFNIRPKGSGVAYYIASHCHPHQYEMLRFCDMRVWHAWTDLDEQKAEYLKFPHHERDGMPIDVVDVPEGMVWNGRVADYGIVGGGSTTFSRAMNIGFYLGFRDFEFFGFDSSFEKGGESHYVMSLVGEELPTMDVQFRVNGHPGPVFWAKAFMARQAAEVMGVFMGTGASEGPHNPWTRIPNRIRFHGPGLLPSWHRAVFPQMYTEENHA